MAIQQWELAFIYDYYDHEAVNTIGLEYDDASYAGSILDAIDSVTTHWHTDVMANMSHDVLLKRTEAADYAVGSSAFAQQAYSLQGGSDSAPLPPNCAYLLRKSVDGVRRGGRAFLPGVIASQVGDTGLLSASFATGMNAAVESFRTKVETDGLLLGVAQNNSFNVINRLSIDSKISTQRRRLR